MSAVSDAGTQVPFEAKLQGFRPRGRSSPGRVLRTFSA